MILYIKHIDNGTYEGSLDSDYPGSYGIEIDAATILDWQSSGRLLLSGLWTPEHERGVYNNFLKYKHK